MSKYGYLTEFISGSTRKLLIKVKIHMLIIIIYDFIAYKYFEFDQTFYDFIFNIL